MWTRRDVARSLALAGLMLGLGLAEPAQAAPTMRSGVVHGVVTSQAEGLVLPRVSVTLRSETHTGFIRVRATNKKGAFRFDELPAGLYSLEATHPDYDRVRLAPILVLEDGERKAHLSLPPPPERRGNT